MTASQNVFELFAEQAARQPDAIAVIDTRSHSYADLFDRACDIAAGLCAHVTAGEPIGVLLPRNADLVAALLAVWKVGCPYVPLDPDHPAERNRQIARAAGCSIVVSTAELFGVFAGGSTGSAPAGLFLDALAVEGSASHHTLAGDSLAYVMFTSGSTGTPKGVEVEHRSVANLLIAMRELLQFGAKDRYLAVSTIGFDISIAELFLPLVVGASLLLRDRSLLLDPRGLAAEIDAFGVTVFQTGPAVWRTLFDSGVALPRLRVAITTGEAVSPALADRIATAGTQAWNLYGPTEATVWATGHPLHAAFSTALTGNVRSEVSAPIGRSLAGLDAIVVDDAGREAPVGTLGELWLGGIALARGYRNNPELTEQRFVLRSGGHRYYRTGDVVLRDNIGVLHYFGRLDDQIKVNGVRIEPMEVESAIMSWGGLSAAAATWIESTAGSRSVVAGIVAQPGTPHDAEALRNHVAAQLPSAMVPSRIVFLDDLPLTPSGKVDRSHIRLLACGTNSTASSERAPTATEQRIIAIWRSVLGCDRLDPSDNFFSAGGDSLAAVAVMLDVESEFGIAAPVRLLFESPTVSKLAARIDQVSNPRRSTSEPSQFILPLSQRGDGTPVFFFGVDLRIARPDIWTIECPLYAVSHWAQGKGFSDARSVEELAARQLEGIVQIQPEGPYRLAGFSFGGIAAVEAARQLRARGTEVEVLFLLDPMEPYRLGNAPDVVRPQASLRSPRPITAALRADIGDLRRRLATSPDRVRSLSGAARSATARLSLRVVNLGGRIPAWQWINYQIVHLHGRSPNAISRAILPKNRWPAVWYATHRLARNYVAPPYDGPASAVFLDRGPRFDAWSQLLGRGARIEVVHADRHTNLFDQPVAREWIEILRSQLAPSPALAAG